MESKRKSRIPRRVPHIRPSKYEASEAINNNKTYWNKVFSELDDYKVSTIHESQKFAQVLPYTIYRSVCQILDLPVVHQSRDKTRETEGYKSRRLIKEPLLSSRKSLYIDREQESDTDVEYPSDDDEEEEFKPNIHQEFLSKPEREQVTWATRYLKPEREDEKSLVRKADDLTDRIANEFCEYMKQLGGNQQSQLFKPKAIKELFQIEFDTHVARGLSVVTKELPCVNDKIATVTELPEKSEYAALEREITKDIKAEMKPDKLKAFSRSLPQKEQLRAPRNNTKAMWKSARHVPKDLVTLKTVWDGITNLRSVKEYCRWMIEHPEYRRAPYLSSLGMFDPVVLDARLTFEGTTITNSPQPVSFWETQRKTVQQLVGPVMFPRIAKIFNLPPHLTQYEPPSETTSRVPSDQYYLNKRSSEVSGRRPEFSFSDFVPSAFEENVEEESEETSDQWSEDTQTASTLTRQKSSSRKNFVREHSRGDFIKASRNFSRMISSKSFSQRMISTQAVGCSRSKTKSELTFTDSLAGSQDDMDVHLASIYGLKRSYDRTNPHFDMLYCNASETDMIKWKSKYKQKAFEISASDEFSKRAEILTKQIAKDFYEWWAALGSKEYRSEIKRPEDIEDLFQVWFDEHASRCLKLDPKILPCVLQTIANYVREPQASCPRVLKRQIAHDIHAEKKPAHLFAFNAALPQKLKHIPPRNNTSKLWECVKIPEDLESMAAVWDDIRHLTSTKMFAHWLKQRPHLPMPPCLDDSKIKEKKQLFVVPSDYIVGDQTNQDRGLALPISEYNFELKEVISKLMN